MAMVSKYQTRKDVAPVLADNKGKKIGILVVAYNAVTTLTSVLTFRETIAQSNTIFLSPHVGLDLCA